MVIAESLPNISFNTESATSSKNEELTTYTLENQDLIASILSIEGNQDKFAKWQSRKRISNKIEAKKRRNLPNKIFEYIHVARCHRLVSLAWYDNITYTRLDDDGVTKPLLILCCNGSDRLLVKPDYLKREPFIDLTPIKPTKTDREWIACQIMALKKWRKATSIKLWSARRVEHFNNISESLFMLNSCLMALSKSSSFFQDYDVLIDFLKSWCGVNRSVSKILACLKFWSAFLPRKTEADNPKTVLPSKAK